MGDPDRLGPRTTLEGVTVETEFYNWQHHTPAPDTRYAKTSPNLEALGDELAKRFQFTGSGGYVLRPVRGGTEWSSHAFGSATDRFYALAARAFVLSTVFPWLILNSAEFHLQAIHDYYGSRIWRAGRTGNTGDALGAWWKAQPSNPSNGMGQSWAHYLHLETTRTGWGDSLPIPNRIGGTPPPKPVPIPTPGGPFVHATIRRGDVNADVFSAQVILRHRAGQVGVVCDGQFGAQTETAVRNVQAFTGSTVDGVVGPQTWGVLDFLANS